MTEKALKPIDRLKNALSVPQVKEQFQNALGKHANKFIASVISAYQEDLQKCAPADVIKETLKAAVLRLPIEKNLGFAYIIPYNKKPQFQIGYKGMIQLAMRTGQVKTINGGPVFAGEFKGTDKLSGDIDLTGRKQSDEITGYFAYLELINGFKKAEYWSKDRVIEHAKKYSKSYGNKNSAYATNFNEMATKTVLKSILGKYAPMSIDFITAINQDEPKEAPEIIDITPPSRPKKDNLEDIKGDIPKDTKNDKDGDQEFFDKQFDDLVEPDFGE